MFDGFLLNAEPIMVIEGLPGTGKTWLTKYLIKSAQAQAGIIRLITGENCETNIILTATTNKAARVLAEKTGMETRTIHSLLGLKVTNDFKTGVVSLQKTGKSKPIHNTLIFVDECSMMNKRLMQLVQEMTVDCKVVFILDPYQLAPVGEQVCPATNFSNKSTLHEVKRQKGKGLKLHPIAKLGKQFRGTVDSGVFPEIIPNGDSILHVDGEVFQQMVEAEFLLGNGPDHCRMLAWTNDRVKDYNAHVRSLFTQSVEYQVGELVTTNKPIMGSGTVVFTTDETTTIKKVGNLEQVDGVSGRYLTLERGVRVFQPDDLKAATAVIRGYAKAKDWTSYFEAKDFYADLRPLHASTVHKSQGSTFHTAFVDLDDIGRCNQPMDVARMLNVATTRASHRVVFYGELPDKYRGK